MRHILAIDGGGIKGVVPAAFLAQVEQVLGERVAPYFDLIAGTSTGGIIALGLGLGLSASEILKFYTRLGPSVFAGGVFFRSMRRLGVAKYDAGSLRKALEQTFGDRTLGESTTRLIIPSLNLETGRVHIFKTAHHPRFEIDYQERAVDVALATAAAPTYFPTYRSSKGIPLIDGGTWANNPVGLAVVEALGVLDWPRDDVKVLSLGCAAEPLSVSAARSRALGLGYWAFKIAEVFMMAQSHAALGMASVLIGQENIVRISPTVDRGRFRLDSVKEEASLSGLGASEARQALPRLRTLFFDQQAAPFVPRH